MAQPYTQVTAFVSSDGGSFNGFWIHEKDQGPPYSSHSRDVDFNKDHVHPLLKKAAEIRTKNHREMLEIFKLAVEDESFLESVEIYHKNNRNLNWRHILGLEVICPSQMIVGVNHRCSTHTLISFIEKKIDKENISFIDQLKERIFAITLPFSFIK